MEWLHTCRLITPEASHFMFGHAIFFIPLLHIASETQLQDPLLVDKL